MTEAAERRLAPIDICMADSMPWQQHWEARTTWPLAEILHDKFFLNLRSHLRAGDAISICRYDGKDPSHKSITLLEVATVRVIESGPDAKSVPLALIGDIGRLPGIVEAPPADLKIAAGDAGKFRLLSGDKLVEEFGSRKEADAALKKVQAA